MISAILKIFVILVVVLVSTACVQHLRNSGTLSVPPRQPDTLRLATYNVHYIWLGRQTGAWSVGDWERRKGPLDEAFKALDADIVAFQEMESFSRGSDGSVNLTRDWLLENNPDYRAAAVGDWREFPSTQPIFYRAGAFDVIDQGWFFFSDTPDVIYSRTFNGSFPAFASWAEFRRSDGQVFKVVNVHFEYSSGSNRLLSAELVAKRIGPWIAAGETVFLTGDLNARLGAPTVKILEAAGLTFAPVQGATYHFNRGINLFGAIDHIAVSVDAELATPPIVLRERFNHEWPTDHYPVFGDYRLR